MYCGAFPKSRCHSGPSLGNLSREILQLDIAPDEPLAQVCLKSSAVLSLLGQELPFLSVFLKF